MNFNSAAVSASDPNAPLTRRLQALSVFQVFNDILVLNGPGFNNGSATSARAGFNASGSNEWDGSVVLGSAAPSLANPYINTAANSQLIVSGVVSDPNQLSSLDQDRRGRVDS